MFQELWSRKIVRSKVSQLLISSLSVYSCAYFAKQAITLASLGRKVVLCTIIETAEWAENSQTRILLNK